MNSGRKIFLCQAFCGIRSLYDLFAFGKVCDLVINQHSCVKDGLFLVYYARYFDFDLYCCACKPDNERIVMEK